MVDDIILDLREYKSSGHPEITKEMVRFPKAPARPQPGQPVPLELEPPNPPEVQPVINKVKQQFDAPVEFHAMGAVPEGFNEHEATNQMVAEAVLGGVEKQNIETKRAIADIQDNSVGLFARFRPPAAARDGADHAKYIQDIYTQFARYDKEIPHELAEMYKTARKQFGPDDFDTIAAIMRDMGYDENGSIEIPPGTPQNLVEPAKILFNIKNRIYTEITGNGPQVPYILDRWALPHNELTIARLKLIQDLGDAGIIRLNRSRQPVTVFEQNAAEETKGMLNGRPWHDQNVEHFLGFLDIQPIDNEEALLEDLIRGHEGVAGPSTQAELDAYKENLDRLRYLKTQVLRDAYRRLPSRDYIPRKAFYGPVAVSRIPEVQARFYDTNPDLVFSKWVQGGLRKAKSDYILWRTRPFTGRESTLDAATKEYYTDLANVVRGASAYRGDAKIANWFNRSRLLTKIFGPMTASRVHSITDFILGWQTDTKLFLTPFRFPVINLTHPFVTLYPVVGEKYFSMGLARILKNPLRAFTDAANAGYIGHESQWFEEISGESAERSPITRLLGRNGARLLRAPTYWTENFRKVLARESFLAMAQDEQFSPLVRGFAKEGPWENLTQRNEAYARAGVATTQFEFGPTGKPVWFTGSPAKRLITQFKSWPAGITSLYLDMLKNPVQNRAALLRGLTTMFFFGGLPAVMGFRGAFELLRHELLKHGYYLPDQTGFQMSVEAAGLGGTGLETADILSLREPFGLEPYSVSSLFGPAIGSALDVIGPRGTFWTGIAEDNYKKAIASPIAALIGPQAEALIQGGREFYQGGKVFGPSGELEATRPALSAIVRGIDWAPSSKSEIWKVSQDLADAIESGNQDLVRRIAEDATARGIILGPQMDSRVRAILSKRRRNEFTWDSLVQ